MLVLFFLVKVKELEKAPKWDGHTPQVAIDRISKLSADVVEVRHGEWREVNDKYPRYVCTVCNHLFNNKNYNYCPCCGAEITAGQQLCLNCRVYLWEVV